MKKKITIINYKKKFLLLDALTAHKIMINNYYTKLNEKIKNKTTKMIIIQ